MKFFKTKIFALIGFSLFLISCSPSISVKAENSVAIVVYGIRKQRKLWTVINP